MRRSMRASATRSLLPLAPYLILALVVFLTLFPVEVVRVDDAQVFRGAFGWPALPQWVTLPVIFLLSFGAMAAIAEGVARAFAEFAPLEAYRLDIGGSVLGIAGWA